MAQARMFCQHPGDDVDAIEGLRSKSVLDGWCSACGALRFFPSPKDPTRTDHSDGRTWMIPRHSAEQAAITARLDELVISCERVNVVVPSHEPFKGLRITKVEGGAVWAREVTPSVPGGEVVIAIHAICAIEPLPTS